MVHRNAIKSRIIAIVTACVAGFSGLTPADSLILGPLQIKNAATIHSDGAKLSLENTEYAYFSGDRVVTSSKGSALLSLDDGFALFAPDTTAAVISDQGAYQIDVEAGGVRIGFRHNADFLIRVADITVKPFETNLIKAASGESAIDVAVSINEDGQPMIFVKSGRVNVTSKASGQFQTIAAGEMYSTAQSDGGFRRVAIGGGSTGGGFDPTAAFLITATVLAAVGLDSSGEGSVFRGGN